MNGNFNNKYFGGISDLHNKYFLDTYYELEAFLEGESNFLKNSEKDKE